ncbi:MAG: sugar phosphate isomerase/epimerase [Ferruginibacter sp.]|nr:sugar phosphate isomerase/epimerase [Cytophagales bacterium]
MNQRTVFWAANVRSKSFAERLTAAVAGGFTEMSIFPFDVKNFIEGGTSLGQLKKMAADQGVRISVLDPFTTWVPDTTPAAWAKPADIAFANFGEDDIFRMAEGLGVESINLIETYGNPVDTQAATERFAKLAQRGADYGYRIQLEFMPFSGIRDLAKAWDIVRLANAPNGGLTFDTWHYFRGNVDNDLLEAIPGNKIFQVQYSDAKAALNGSLVNDLLHHRLFPGEGDFPLAEIARILTGMGGDQAVGVELFSDRIDAMTPTDAGKQVAESLDNVLKGKLKNKASIAK